jgi:hypothetical protein
VTPTGEILHKAHDQGILDRCIYNDRRNSLEPKFPIGLKSSLTTNQLVTPISSLADRDWALKAQRLYAALEICCQSPTSGSGIQNYDFGYRDI